MVSTVDVTAAQAGVNFFGVPDNTRIHRGDVVAVVIGSGQLRFRSVASSCFEVSSTNAVAASMTCVDGEHQFRAHLVQVKNTMMMMMMIVDWINVSCGNLSIERH